MFVNGRKLPNDRGLYEFNPGTTGTFDYSGYLEVPHGDGSVTRHPFQSSYTVIEPTATVSATMMNVLYAGIDNPISISVPGVATSAVSATMTNGTLSRSGDHWVAHPAKVGDEAVVSVTAQMDGRPMTMAQTKFRVRKPTSPSRTRKATPRAIKAAAADSQRPICSPPPASRPPSTTTCSTSSSRC